MILYLLRSVSKSPGSFNTSAYNPSTGRNMIAKSVVCGGSMYLSEISFADFLMVRINSADAFSIASVSDFSEASFNLM